MPVEDKCEQKLYQQGVHVHERCLFPCNRAMTISLRNRT